MKGKQTECNGFHNLEDSLVTVKSDIEVNWGPKPIQIRKRVDEASFEIKAA